MKTNETKKKPTLSQSLGRVSPSLSFCFSVLDPKGFCFLLITSGEKGDKKRFLSLFYAIIKK